MNIQHVQSLEASRDNGSSFWYNDTNSNFSLYGNHTLHHKYGITSDLWKILLVGSLGTVAVLALVALVLIWRFCSKRPDDATNVRNSITKLDDPSSNTKCCSCSCLSRFKGYLRSRSTAAPPVLDLPTNNGNTTAAAITAKNKVINQPKPFTNGDNFDPGYSKVPLPPITASPSEYRFATQPSPLFAASSVTPLPPTPPGRRAQPHGRLAPLFLDQKHASEPIARFITSNLNGQQQTFSVKGVPEIKVSAGKQRSLPTPPPLG